MPPRKPVNRIAPRVPVKYFAILHGAALMVGTEPGPGGDDSSRKWTLLNKNGRIMPAADMAARYFLFGEGGCAQIGAKAAARMAAQLGGSLEMLITGETWRVIPKAKGHGSKPPRAVRKSQTPARKTSRSLRPR
ncbi:MAG: hypothetical protein M3429_01400 [Verrucomicrobiota bacterium]|nr:hypothetical protein [Verrucomicrobiota bacterium]